MLAYCRFVTSSYLPNQALHSNCKNLPAAINPVVKAFVMAYVLSDCLASVGVNPKV